MPSYFELVPSADAGFFWDLRSPRGTDGEEILPESFTVCEPVCVDTPLYIPIRRQGREAMWTFADFMMPVVRDDVASMLLREVPRDLEIHFAVIEGSHHQYAVLNVLACRACLDEGRSEFLKWTDADERPDRIGEYRQVSRLRVLPGKTRGAEIFRVQGWPIALIVSLRIKELMEAQGVTGVSYHPVG